MDVDRDGRSDARSEALRRMATAESRHAFPDSLPFFDDFRFNSFTLPLTRHRHSKSRGDNDVALAVAAISAYCGNRAAPSCKGSFASYYRGFALSLASHRNQLAPEVLDQHTHEYTCGRPGAYA
jgi:hypothetical protein